MRIILTILLWPLWWFLAWTRLNKNAVCEIKMMHGWDFHDYPDGKNFKEPVHGYEYTCERCGHKFYI